MPNLPNRMASRRDVNKRLRVARWLTAVVCLAAISVWGAELEPAAPVNVSSLAELQNLASQEGRTIQSFRLEGVICAVVQGQKWVALQDGSATVLLELPILEPGIGAGQWIRLEAKNCTVARNRFGLQLGTAPVVDNDGHHATVTKSGRIYLEAGLQPIELAWFNAEGPSELQLEYEGPGIQYQPVPARALLRKSNTSAKPGQFEPGLDFAAYVGENWHALPDFGRLEPVARGVAEDIDLNHRVGTDNTALVFGGFLEVPASGVYTFHLGSDDGSRLFIGNPGESCKVTVLNRKTKPTIRSLEQILADGANEQWTELDGGVTFAGWNGGNLEIDVAGRGDRVPVVVLEGAGLRATNLLNQHIRVVGICEFTGGVEQRRIARILVPDSELVEVRRPQDPGVSSEAFPESVLTTGEQVRRLRPLESRKRQPVRLQGVVTWTIVGALVLQDSTGGVYVQTGRPNWAGEPLVGDRWEIEGTTDPGDFSPIVRARKLRFLGRGSMPDPVRPTWDQLMNGSLDAEYVELRGVVTARSRNEITLLTGDGKIKIKSTFARPLPALVPPISESMLIGGEEKPKTTRDPCLDSLVRLRGCLTALWDPVTRQVRPGEIFLSPARVEVEEAAPVDPFAMPARRLAELRFFDARAGALQRTKVSGQVICARAREYYLQEGPNGMRFRSRELLPLQSGDLVEGVGFPMLGASAPVLQEAQVRRIGHASLPAPVPVGAEDLLNRKHDSTLVQVEAELLGHTAKPGEQVLEMETGSRHFLARLRSDSGAWTPPAAGSRLRLNGVYACAQEEHVDDSFDSFELLLNDAADITVIQTAPWWTIRRAVAVVAALTGFLALALVWITLLRRRVEERTSQLHRQMEERERVERRRAMEEERTRVAQDLHDELGAGLTEVTILGSLARNPSIPADKKESYLEELIEAARRLITGLDEIVWAVNPHYDSVASLASYYSMFAQRFLNLAGIACRLEIAERFPEIPLDSKVRHGIFLAFKEALNNVVRHSGATEVQLRIEVAERWLTVAVLDNGIGLTAPVGAPGSDGIASMTQRIQKLGGECRITSQPGRGTAVEFRLPLEARA
jgi:signal transduction histidine kinase